MKNKIVKQLLGISVATVLFAGMPMFVLADTYDVSYGDVTITATADDVHTVTYYKYNVQEQQIKVGDIDPIVTGTTTEHTVTINADNGTAEVTIRDLKIDVSNTGDYESMDLNGDYNGYGEAAIKTTGTGNVEIEIDGTNTLESGCLCAGLQKENTGNLTIKDENPSENDTPDSLTVTGGKNGAGIGGGYEKDGKDIFIEGGVITADGNGSGAGIGGGDQGDGTVTISGGNVTATGGNSAAGIGGGAGSGDSNGSSLTVSGEAVVKAAAGGGLYNNFDVGAAVGEGGYYNHVAGEFKQPVVLESFTGSVIFYEAGTSVQSMIDHPELNIDTDHHYIGQLPFAIDSGESVIIHTVVPKQNNDNNNSSDMDNNSSNNDSETATPGYTGITTDMLIRQINGLLKTANGGAVTIDFGRNICLTPELMKALFETGNVAKNCTFTYKGKRYNLYIPVIDTKSDKYIKAMEELKKEDNGKGFAGFMRTKDIFKDLGVTADEIK